MSWESFIEKNVREALVKQGYTPAIAQGGGRRSYRPLSAHVTGQRERAHL
ncbi:hypothetical protein GTU79_19650 [Sodalis ligni]|nr:hypothetical protein [Sodalis ligni]QWA09556.1 hypothetical protein GTU79_19650 [Sodalis ligni]